MISAVEINTLMETNESTVKKVKVDDDNNDDLDVKKETSEASDENDDDEMIDDEDDAYDDDDDYMFDQAEDEESHYSKMQAHFDKLDAPPGVEASFSWLNDFPSVKSTKEAPNDHEVLKIPVCRSNDIASSSSSSVPSNVTSSSEAKKEDATEDEVNKKFENFKSFDIVSDFSDHHYTSSGFQGQQPPRGWTKTIQDEWKILEKDLPNTIFVRVYETRMDLLRAVIVGPAGTPYHDGLFVFDIHFPPTYPDTPPMVHYYSGGLRINPNLYNCGKVCLSLLNTWTGHGTEKWIPNKSTMLQVLVSIQALILNDEPFFNEPGYHRSYPGAVGQQKSKEYNESTFILSLKTMIYTLRKPPKHFEDLVAGHFRSRAHVILAACRAYMKGVEVGSTIDGKTPDDKNGSNTFKTTLGRMVNCLVSNFSRYGATDCDRYRVGS